MFRTTIKSSPINHHYRATDNAIAFFFNRTTQRDILEFFGQGQKE